MDQDRRKDRRVPVNLWIEAETGDELYFQRAANLSAGGAYFAQTVPQAPGTQVLLRFQLPGDAAEISCKGEIVSAPEKGLGMSVRFLDLSEGDKGRIEQLIARLAPS